jgi:hypothetical protein
MGFTQGAQMGGRGVMGGEEEGQGVMGGSTGAAPAGCPPLPRSDTHQTSDLNPSYSRREMTSGAA